jgi:hypothetical protein
MTEYSNGADGSCVECGDDTDEEWQLYCTACYFAEHQDDDETTTTTKAPFDWSQFGGTTRPQPRRDLGDDDRDSQPQPRRDLGDDDRAARDAAERDQRRGLALLRLCRAQAQIDHCVAVLRDADTMPTALVNLAVEHAERIADVVGDVSPAEAAMMDDALLRTDEETTDGHRTGEATGRRGRRTEATDGPGRQLR